MSDAGLVGCLWGALAYAVSVLISDTVAGVLRQRDYARCLTPLLASTLPAAIMPIVWPSVVTAVALAALWRNVTAPRQYREYLHATRQLKHKGTP